MDSSFYAGVFVESGARPNIVSNTFHGGDDGSVKNSVTQVKGEKLMSPMMLFNPIARSAEDLACCSSCPPRACWGRTSLRTSQ